MMANNVCRCCLSKACFKDISNEYFNNGYKEVYAELILDTFNIHISYQDSNTRLICEECITRLRDAAAFKRQVLQVEDAVTKRITNGFCINGGIKSIDKQDDFIDHITAEFEDGIAEDEDDERNNFDDGSYWPNDDFNQEHDHENLFVIKLDPEDDIPLQVLQKTSKLSNIKKEKIGTCKALNSKRDQPKLRIKKPQSDRKENSLKLINNSNICLFESLKTKFRCFYCKNSYFNITELREHTQSHSDPRYLKMCINRLKGMSYKCVDISKLTCRICNDILNDLNDLKAHLTERHDIQFCGEENMLIQYRLENGFQCVMCEQSFNTFFKLSVHMNIHYTNHVCEICGASYINRLSLRMHVNSRHKEKKCSFCSMKFLNAYLRVKHMRKVHNTSESKRHCLLCDKTFRYTYLLDEHKIQEHGMKRSVAACPQCGKSFLSPVNLRTHIRCVHIKERNHPCALCGMSFFTSCDRRRHERTHQDLRSFSCSYCAGRFKSKDSLRRHLKRQHGHLFNPSPGRV